MQKLGVLGAGSVSRVGPGGRKVCGKLKVLGAGSVCRVGKGSMREAEVGGPGGWLGEQR